MFRNFLFRHGIPVLVLTLVLFGAAPAAAEPSFLDRWDGMWRWVVSVWSEEETEDGDRGLGLDPDGLTIGDRGPEADPNGSTSNEEDRGLELDPNG